MRHPPLKSAALALGLLALACGGAPQPPPAAQDPAAGGLAAVLAAQAAPQAVITFAVFSPDPPPERPDKAARGLTSELERAFAMPPPALAEAVKRAGGRPPSLVLSPLPVAELPLRVEVLAEGAGPAGEALAAARSVILVRYKGPALADEAQLWGTGAAAGILAGEGDGWVVADLSTLQSFLAPAWRAALARPDWIASQVIIEAAQAPDGIEFSTRGMAKLALPDLERTGVAPAQARAAFAHFQETYAAVRREGPEGPTLAGLGTCVRPAERWDQACRALSP